MFDPLWITAIFTATSAVGNCVMAIGAIGLLILSLVVYIRQRPKTRVKIIDEKGEKGNECYYAAMSDERGIPHYFYIICLKLTIFQYVTSSQLTNMRILIRKDGHIIGSGAITILALKSPSTLPTDRDSFVLFLGGARRRDLFSGRMSDYHIEGCMSKELIAITDTDIIFVNPITEGVSIDFSFTVGVKEFGPYNLKLKQLFE